MRRSRTAAQVVEGEYETGAQEQLYIEPNGMLAVADPRRASPSGARCSARTTSTRRSLGCSTCRPNEVRVVQMETGGGFGGKEEYPSIIAGHAALLAWKSGRPVKMIYDRAEDMVATTKRHPSRTRHRTAIDARRQAARDGHRVRHRRRRVLHAVAGRAVARNDSRGRTVLLPERAHPRRGGGDQRPAARRVPRLRRAAEHLRARAADGPRRAAAGLSPDEFRRRNFISHRADERRRSDHPRAGGHDGAARSRLRAVRIITRSAPGSPRDNARSPYAAASASPPSCTAPASPDPASSTSRRSSASRRTADGHIRVLAASTEIGQGTNTIFAQIAARRSRHRLRRRRGRAAGYGRGAQQRSDRRVAHVHGRRQAGGDRALGLKPTLVGRRLLRESYDSAAFRAAAAAYVAQHGSLRGTAQYQPPEGFTGTTRSTRATPTALTPGRSTWRKSPSIW